MARYIINRILISIPSCWEFPWCFPPGAGLRDPMAFTTLIRIFLLLILNAWKRLTVWINGHCAILLLAAPGRHRDWGQSFLPSKVTDMIRDGWQYHYLMVTSFVMTLIIALVLGIYSATHQYSAGDYIVTSVSFFGYSMRVFGLA